ncbi:hypothetical protein [Acidovorax sp.]|uniref:hypothetical protein n=1 Tax=Acidovorax sp. TaxID=1872122 RepID=UPI002ACD9B27|nr:hypothetical protein [Acidovorax sp.]MDZ7862850.1 hypothetical protein [Acidovorax sp.]
MKKIAIAAACLVVFSALGQKKPAGWPNEPTAVFGVPIGEKLENDRIGQCGGVKADAEKNPVAVCAMERPGYGGIIIAGFPVPVFDGGYIDRDDGVVTSIILHGKHSNYRDIKALLMERYGKPTRTWTEKLQNKMGATFSSEALDWEGKSVTLKLRERSDTVDQTSVFFTSQSHLNKKATEREKSLKESATKM